MYEILPYTLKKARALGVQVRPSSSKKKKIDVYKKGKKIASVGGYGYDDYPTFMKKYGKTYANRKRRLYKQRHEKDRHKKGSAGYYADQLLW